MNIFKNYKSLPKDSRNLLKIGILVALFFALPLFVWAIVSQNFDLRNRAATAESPSPTQPIVCNYSINPPKYCPQGYYCNQTNNTNNMVGANGICIKNPTPTPTPYITSCPSPRPLAAGGTCIQSISFALNPTNYTCCQYPNPCSVPLNWTKYTSNSSCLKSVCEKEFSGSPSSYENLACTKAGGNMYCGNGWCRCSCSTQTYSPTPTPYITPFPTPTYTPYPTPSQTPLPIYWNQVFNIRFKLSGVFDESADQPKVSIRFSNPSIGFDYTTANPITARYINNGVYEANFIVGTSPSTTPTIPSAHGYSIYIKGEKHVSKKFCQPNSQISQCTGSGQIFITAMQNASYIHDFDFTGLPLEPGDLYPQDGMADINDFAKIKSVMGKMCENQTAADLMVADLDYSGCVNIVDAFLMRKTLEVRYDEF